MDSIQIYDDFIERHKDIPSYLARLISSERGNLPPPRETAAYNLGTMQKDADIAFSDNIAIANAHRFQTEFNRYKTENPQMGDTEARARVVFDFLQQNHSPFSYDKNKSDILWGNVTRELFYGAPKDSVYANATSNTNFFDRNIGNMQIICMEPKSADSLPRNVAGLSEETKAAFLAIPPEERLTILLKRGFYHESIHATMPTTDERKCDAFAMLKVMKEHPAHTQTIFDIYNMQRSKTGHTIENMYQKREGTNDFRREIKKGTMTYIMPETYKKLEEYAKHPEKIPVDDGSLLKLACSLTSEPEFSDKQLDAFVSLMSQKEITANDLANNEIIQSCMRQGKFTDINAYIKSDNALNKFIEKQKFQKSMRKITELRQKISPSGIRPPLTAEKTKEKRQISPMVLKTYQNSKQNN